MKKGSLHKKLTSYSALAASIIGIQKTSHAQIIYTDVNPDVTITNGFYNLDLNNDGTTDFKIAQKYGTSAYGFNYNAVYIHPELAANAIDTANGGNLMVEATDSAFNVNPSLNWVDSAVATGTFTTVLALDVSYLNYSLGNFLGQNGKFLPVKFDVSGNTHYGWVRLNVDSTATSFKVIDYAYESMPDTPILTGHFSTTNIQENPNTAIHIFSEKNSIFIQFQQYIPDAFVSIYNSIGQLVKRSSITEAETILKINEISSGIFIVQISAPSRIYSKKVFLHE